MFEMSHEAGGEVLDGIMSEGNIDGAERLQIRIRIMRVLAKKSLPHLFGVSCPETWLASQLL